MNQYEPLILKDYANKVKKQILSGWIGSGQTTINFENKICEITGSKYCLSTTSGTTAILIALATQKSKNVIFPAYTFLAGANAAKFLKMKVKLVDVKRNTMSLNLLKKSDVVIFVNHNGYVGEDVQKTKKLCNFMIEDSSQALGIKNAGRTGDVGIFSFSVPKIVTTGQGGCLITDNQEIYEKCKQIRDHGDNWRKTRIHNNLGVNFKFNDILAAYGLAQLEILNNLLEERQRIFDIYRKYIKIIDFGYPSTWMIIYESSKLNKIIEELNKNNIQAVKYYLPINHNPPYYNNKTYSEAEYIYNNFIYLPSSLTLKNKEIKEICDIINNIWQH